MCGRHGDGEADHKITVQRCRGDIAFKGDRRRRLNGHDFTQTGFAVEEVVNIISGGDDPASGIIGGQSVRADIELERDAGTGDAVLGSTGHKITGTESIGISGGSGEGGTGIQSGCGIDPLTVSGGIVNVERIRCFDSRNLFRDGAGFSDQYAAVCLPAVFVDGNRPGLNLVRCCAVRHIDNHSVNVQHVMFIGECQCGRIRTESGEHGVIAPVSAGRLDVCVIAGHGPVRIVPHIEVGITGSCQ